MVKWLNYNLAKLYTNVSFNIQQGRVLVAVCHCTFVSVFICVFHHSNVHLHIGLCGQNFPFFSFINIIYIW